MGLILSLCANGCASTKPTPKKEWVPETKVEMRMLIGQTVLEALYQYAQRMIELEKKPLQEKLEDEANRM